MSHLSASGARVRGDDYQHLFAWCQIVRVLQPDSDITAIGVEDPDAASVDDVTVYRSRDPNEFFQCKSSVTLAELANTPWLLAPSKTGGPSILQRFRASWLKLEKRGKLYLITNRQLDANDPVLVLLDGKDGTLHRRLGSPTTATARRLLADHLKMDEASLLEFLEPLHFRVGKLHEDWEQLAAILMSAVGLRYDSDAIRLGIDAVRRWVTDGKRRLSAEEIEREIARLNLHREQPATTLLVQAIDRDPAPEAATVVLDWIDLYEGTEARQRRHLTDPSLWNGKMRPELKQAVARIRASGCHRVFVRGYMRLPTWFTVGTEFARTAGFEVMSLQNGQLIESWGENDSYPVAVTRNEELGSGAAIALGISLATDLSGDALLYLRRARPEVGRYLCISPTFGCSGTALRSPAEARGWAIAVRDLARDISRETGAKRLHVFLAAPSSATLLLGHLWDRLPETQLYEDQGSGVGYEPAFLIPN